MPAGVPREAFGPRPHATVVLLTGAYRLCRLRIRAPLADLLGLDISTGMVRETERAVAEAVSAPVEAVYGHVCTAPSAGMDGTGWREDKRRAWLRVAVTGGATALRIAGSRGADALYQLVGEPVLRAVVWDRFPTYARAGRRAGLTFEEISDR